MFLDFPAAMTAAAGGTGLGAILLEFVPALEDVIRYNSPGFP
ncbi:hypothetical protein KNP414_01000 [Paenibacillus mucilaginosus KNP414]|uniref:Uncharacterized protein n=1 Tax=Paenibacillus mucilaginosus (strain KNP414) TaxID=1036673 RepID=F8FAD7_PAEMK|nr:hypothetical protein KNP414_01000 [Paenibacillus mucilaginosus KNP414]